MIGLDRFREYFAGQEAQYVLIGGAACDILMAEQGLEFRNTKDLDVVLCVEAIDPTFAKRFWAFIEAGGYENRQKGETKQFYRFDKPKVEGFPKQIELFSRQPEGVVLDGEPHLTPIPLGEDVASLSAILLNTPYYDALIAGTRLVDGVRILDEGLIIPFKARAHLDMVERRDAGGQVDSKEIIKHRNDVFRLLQVFDATRHVELPEVLKTDLQTFAAAVEADPDFDPKPLSVGLKIKAEALDRLRSAFLLS